MQSTTYGISAPCSFATACRSPSLVHRLRLEWLFVMFGVCNGYMNTPKCTHTIQSKFCDYEIVNAKCLLRASYRPIGRPVRSAAFSFSPILLSDRVLFFLYDFGQIRKILRLFSPNQICSSVNAVNKCRYCPRLMFV